MHKTSPTYPPYVPLFYFYPKVWTRTSIESAFCATKNYIHFRALHIHQSTVVMVLTLASYTTCPDCVGEDLNVLIHSVWCHPTHQKMGGGPQGQHHYLAHRYRFPPWPERSCPSDHIRHCIQVTWVMNGIMNLLSWRRVLSSGNTVNVLIGRQYQRSQILVARPSATPTGVPHQPPAQC